MVIFHDPRCADYGTSAHPEQPARILKTVPYLRDRWPGADWRLPPDGLADSVLLLAHDRSHLERLGQARDFDGDTPYYPGIGEHARRAAAAAVEAARTAFHLPRPSPVISLMRPPGHHATRSRAMGFCYLNHIAVAACLARSEWDAQRVAIWDFDAHHGNGTEDILLKKPGFLYCSVHQYPGYPGTGTHDLGNSRNWAVPPGTPRERHLAALRASWEAVVGFRPDLLLISAGFDAYRGDPITDMTLEREDFAVLGAWVQASGLPAAAILEGGYSPDLPQLVEAFLEGWEGD